MVGMTKTAIFKAIKSGKISAEKDTHGEWRIEPIELTRHFKPVSDSSRNPPPPSLQQTADSLQREIQLLREMLQAKDEVIKAKDDALDDLRRAMLVIEARTAAPAPQTEVQPTAPPSPAQQPDKPKTFWARLFGR
jgi:hypothetical protein